MRHPQRRLHPRPARLQDEPATACYLPEHRAQLRWLASCEAELVAGAERVLTSPFTAWENCGTWTTDGPAVLMDSVSAGADLNVEYSGGGLPDSASVPLPTGTRKVRAVHTEADEHTWVGLVQLLQLRCRETGPRDEAAPTRVAERRWGPRRRRGPAQSRIAVASTSTKTSGSNR
ncbi:Imm21 family immunity protein [Streptomyces paradoxus]|uniref:Imm21 family immunity protein n=1 Tax=Streptomyces paradoxus TaxID=66375 RepID=UPI0036FFCCAD